VAASSIRHRILRWTVVLACSSAGGRAGAVPLLSTLVASDPGSIDGRAIDPATFAAFVLTEHGKAAIGNETLDFLIQERLVEVESRRRGVAVTDGDVAAKLAELEARIRAESKGRLGIEDQRRASGVDESTFHRVLRRGIAAERMMRSDFGLPEGDVKPEKQALWYQEQRVREGVRTSGIATGLAAEFGEERITRVDWGHELFRALSKEDRDLLFDEFVGVELLLVAASRAGLAVTPEHVEREIAERDAALVAKLREAGMSSEGVSWRSTLVARGDDPDAVLAGSRFKAEILLKELTRQRHGKDGFRRFYDDHRAEFDQSFGRRVRLATIFLRADAQKGGKAGRTWPEATAELDALRARCAAGDLPQAEAFASFARLKSQHESASRGGELGFLSEAALSKSGLPASLIDETPGALVGPITVATGVHLLRVVEQRSASPFDEIRGEVEKAARRTLLQELRQSAKVERRI
jgi:hypothetical protein